MEVDKRGGLLLHAHASAERDGVAGGESREDCDGYSKYRVRGSGRVVEKICVGAASATGPRLGCRLKEAKRCDNESGFANDDCREKVIGAQDAMA